jgi:fermentation-respiration switch protein FrsA (DUF1100 family)
VATLKFLAAAAVVGYLAIALLVWVMQERLLFYPRPLGGPVAPPPGWSLEDVKLAARDGTAIAGVLVKPRAPRAPLVIYYGGNAEEPTSYAGEAAKTYGERAVLLMNYRGFGASGGKPGESALISDALEIFDWAAKRADIDGTRIALHGRSLGTGVAVQVAAERPARCVILTSPFDSARTVAEKIYPWLPVALLLRHPFDSLAVAPKVHLPALVIMGDTDTLIPPAHSEALAAAWGGKAERVVMKGFGHNDLSLTPAYDAAIRDFLERNH